MADAGPYDVIVVGAGNAALCAALSAQEQGAKVLVLEKANEEERGGNSTFTAGGFRFVHHGTDDLRRDVLVDLSDAEAKQMYIPPFTAEIYMDDLMKVTENLSEPELADLLVNRSRETVVWMREKGVRWIPMFKRQSYLVNGIQHFFGGMAVEAVGGGWGLVDFLFRSAERNGIPVRYNTGLRKLIQNRKGEVTGVTVFGPDGYEDISAKSVVLACGGFEADPEMRVRYYGPGWEMARVRGTRHNTGDGIKAALEIGAAAFGGWSTCHAVQWDLSAPPFGDRVVLDNYQKHSYPIGIIVNANGERFVDEGADFRNHTYAKYGREVMKQPQRMAVQIFDKKTIDMTRDEYRIRQVTKAEANTLEELAQKLEISPEGLVRTVQRIQRGVPARGLQSGNPRRQGHLGHHAAQIQLGAADRRTAVPRVRGDLRHHIQLRWVEDHHGWCGGGHHGACHPRPVRRRRTGGRRVLPELPGRCGADVRFGVRADRRAVGREAREGIGPTRLSREERKRRSHPHLLYARRDGDGFIASLLAMTGRVFLPLGPHPQYPLEPRTVLRPHLRIDQPRRAFAVQDVDQLLGREPCHVVAQLIRCSGGMRADQHVIERHQPVVVRRRFILPHIQSRTRNLLRRQRIGQRVLVVDAAPRRGDEIRMLLHQRELARAHQVLRLLRIGRIHRHVVRLTQHVVELLPRCLGWVETSLSLLGQGALPTW